MPSEIDAIRQEIAELRAEIRKPAKRKDRRAILQCRMNDDEMILLDAACAQRGLCRADMVRLGLNAVIGADLRINRDIPPELRRFTVRHKPEHFSDQKTSVVERNAATARELAGKALSARIAYQDAIAQGHAATAARPPVTSGMIADSRAAPSLGKPSR